MRIVNICIMSARNLDTTPSKPPFVKENIIGFAGWLLRLGLILNYSRGSREGNKRCNRGFEDQ